MEREERDAYDLAIEYYTDGLPFCLVIMGFALPDSVLVAIERAVCREGRLACVRADRIAGAFGDRLQKLHAIINRAALVIADISPQKRRGQRQVLPSENVYYEIGYAAARAKPLIVIGHVKTRLPYDFGGKELIQYDDSAQGYEKLADGLRQNIEIVLRADARARLRTFLAPGDPSPSLVLADPKKEPIHPAPGRPQEKRTFGDNLGIVGLFRAFGLVFGETHVPELITASRAEPETVCGDSNLFLIGFGKVNWFSYEYLEQMQHARYPRLILRPHPGNPYETDPECQFTCSPLKAFPDGIATPLRGSKAVQGDHEEDYGVIIRGPKPAVTHPDTRNPFWQFLSDSDRERLSSSQTDYPQWPGRTVMILAGAHSLGTAAACMAATRSEIIEAIAARLGDVDLSQTDRTIWVLVKGTTPRPDWHLDPENVTVLDAGVYPSATDVEKAARGK